MGTDAVRPLTPREEELADLLTDLGLPRTHARAAVFLARVDEAVSPAVEAGTGLRQPEVSVAMQALRTREWVAKRDIHRGGRGRPMHCYKLVVPLDTVIEAVEAEKREELQRIEEKLARLRKLAGNRVTRK